MQYIPLRVFLILFLWPNTQCSKGKGRDSVLQRIPVLVVHRSIFGALAMAEVFCMHTYTWRRLKQHLLPTFLQHNSLKQNEIEIKGRQKVCDAQD